MTDDDRDDGFPADAGKSSSPTEGESNSQTDGGTVYRTVPSSQYESSPEVLEAVDEAIQEFSDEAPDNINGHCETRYVSVGSGSGNLGASVGLTVIDRNLVEFAGPYDGTLKMNSSNRGDEVKFILVDSESRENILGNINTALLALEDDEEAREIYEYFDNDERVRAISGPNGCGRDPTRLYGRAAQNYGDFHPVVKMLTPECCMDSIIFLPTGGGTATGYVGVLDRQFRVGPLQSSTLGGHFHQAVLQIETRTDNAAIEPVHGEQTTTNALQAEAVEQVMNLLDDGFLGAAHHTSKMHLAHSNAVFTSGLGTEDIEETIGSPGDSVDWDQCTKIEKNRKPVAQSRIESVLNEQIRRFVTAEHILRTQPDRYTFQTSEGDYDVADHLGAELAGGVHVPAFFSIAKPEDIHGRHKEFSSPHYLETCTRAGVRFLPWVRQGPFASDHVESATVAVGIADEKEFDAADVYQHIDRQMAEELDLSTVDVTGVAINNLHPGTFPGGESWLDFFALFELETDYVCEVTKQL